MEGERREHIYSAFEERLEAEQDMELSVLSEIWNIWKGLMKVE